MLYLISCQKSGGIPYPLAGNQVQPLEIDAVLDFLPEGKVFRLTSFEDGINADRQAMHYVKNVREVRKGDTVKIRMVRNGGYAASLEAL